MFNKASLLLTICLASAFVQLTAAQEKCQACMANLAYCEDEKTYYLCPDEKNPSRNSLLSCAEDEVCTTDPKICVKSKEVAAPITTPCSSSCGTCPTDSTKKLTCVGRNEFTLCSGSPSSKTTISGFCSDDQICSMDSYMANADICIPQCVADHFGYKTTCTADKLTTTTTQSPTPTPNPDILRLQCQNDRVNHPNDLYYYVSNTDDTSCRSYIYCEPSTNGMEAIHIKCRTGYYDASTGKCVTIKPRSCTV